MQSQTSRLRQSDRSLMYSVLIPHYANAPPNRRTARAPFLYPVRCGVPFRASFPTRRHHAPTCGQKKSRPGFANRDFHLAAPNRSRSHAIDRVYSIESFLHRDQIVAARSCRFNSGSGKERGQIFSDSTYRVAPVRPARPQAGWHLFGGGAGYLRQLQPCIEALRWR
jgi:hypothetical protein